MASWTPPVILSTGAVLASTDYNGVANNTTFLYQAPYISAYNSVATPLSAGVYTQVTLGNIDWSGYGFPLPSGNNNNLVVPIAGIYSVSGAVQFATNVSGQSIAAIFRNGSVFKGGSYAVNTNDSISVVACEAVKCDAGDTIALYAFQNTGSPINTVPGSAVTAISAVFRGSQ